MTALKKYELSLKQVQTNFPVVQIRCADDAEEVIRQFYESDIEIFESFFILLLNRQSKTIGFAKIGQGGVAGVFVDVKIIAKYAVDALACGVILAHNHPSGNLTPSKEDEILTKKAVEGLRCLDIQVIDHLILTADTYFSFAKEGLL